MRGILYKDLITVRKSIFIYVLLVILLAGFGDGFQVTLGMVYSIMLPVSLLGYDERAHFERLLAAMPPSPLVRVLDKYIFAYGSIAFALLVVLARGLLLPALTVEPWMIVISCAMALMSTAVALPLVFHWGTERGRGIYLLTIGVQMALCFVIRDVAGGLSENGVLAGSFAAVAVSVIANGVSIMLSQRLYARRLAA